MVQIIEENKPSFSQMIAKGLGGSIGSALQGGLEGHIEKREKEKQNALRSESNQQILKNYGIDLSGITDPKERQTFISESLKGERKRSELQSKENKDQQAKQKESEEFKELFSQIEDLIPYAGAPIGKALWSKFPWSKAAEKREEMDVLSFQLERYARAAHTKGALSTRVYESLLSKLPDSKLSEAKNRGRLKAWKSSLLGNEEGSSSKSSRPPLESFLE